MAPKPHTGIDTAAAGEGLPAIVDKEVSVMKLSGDVLLTVTPVPKTIMELKQAVLENTSIPTALQNFLALDGIKAYDDLEEMDVTRNHSMLLVTDETPMRTWDVSSTPGGPQLQLEGTSILSCPQLSTDFCTVLTKESVRSGVHYFEFVMHNIGDEQWCGVTSNPNFAGPRANPRIAAECWTYDCGRSYDGGSLKDCRGALHAPGHAVAQFKSLRSQGDVIGMLIDMNIGALALDLNGEVQGACPIQTDKPLYCLTQPDSRVDKIELRKPSLQDAVPANLEALSGALLDITKDGKVVHWADDA